MQNEPSKSDTGTGDDLDRYNEITQMLQSPDEEMETIAERLHAIPELSEKLLAQANSMRSGLKHQIQRVEHAIAIIGRQRALQTVELTRSQLKRKRPSAPHFSKAGKNVERNSST